MTSEAPDKLGETTNLYLAIRDTKTRVERDIQFNLGDGTTNQAFLTSLILLEAVQLQCVHFQSEINVLRDINTKLYNIAMTNSAANGSVTVNSASSHLLKLIEEHPFWTIIAFLVACFGTALAIGEGVWLANHGLPLGLFKNLSG